MKCTNWHFSKIHVEVLQTQTTLTFNSPQLPPWFVTVTPMCNTAAHDKCPAQEVLQNLQGQGDFSSVPLSHAGHTGGVPNDNNFISSFRTLIQVYHKKAFLQTGAGMTLIEPKHHFAHPSPWNNAYTFSLMHQRLPPQTADGPDRPTFHPAVVTVDLRLKNWTDWGPCSPLTVINT